MRRLLVLLTVLVLPLGVVTLWMAAGMSATAATVQETGPVAIPADAGPNAARTAAPEKAVDQQVDHPASAGEAAWLSNGAGDFLRSFDLTQKPDDDIPAAGSPPARITNQPPRPPLEQPAYRPAAQHPDPAERQNGFRPTYRPDAAVEQKRNYQPTYQAVMRPSFPEERNSSQAFVDALTIILSPLHRGAGSSALTSWFVFTNTSVSAANYALDFFWPNGQYLATHNLALPPGGTYFYNMNNAPFGENPWVGAVHITSDQTLVGQITTPDYGWIAGIVVEPDGSTPVQIYNAHLEQYSTQESYGDIYNMSDGRFYLGGLDSQAYRLWVQAGYPWTSQWYDGHGSNESDLADPIDVQASLHYLTVTLQPGGQITGTVYAADGVTPLANINVDADNGGYGTCTDGSGHYVLEGLPYGDHVVYAGGGWNWCIQEVGNYAQEYYQETSQYDQATLITLSSGQDSVADIDFTLDPAGRITGTVYADDGVTPLANVNVDIDNGGYGTCTDQNGNYTIGGLPYDDYKVVAGRGWNWCTQSQSIYLAEYYNEQPTADTATILSLSAGQPLIADIDFTLSTGGQIAGQVRAADGGAPLENVRVEAADYDTAAQWYEGWTDSNGDYTITGLADGDYRVQVTDQNWIPAGYAFQFFDHTFRWDDAARVSVSSGGTTGGIDFDLEAAGVISGVVRDEFGTPLAQINVNANVADGNYGYGTCSDDNGYYEIHVLPHNTWIIEAGGGWNWCQSQPGEYAREYFQETFRWDDAARLTLDAGNPVYQDVDFSLTPGGWITGFVTDESDNPLANIEVKANSESLGYGWNTCTDEYGYYEIYGLAYAGDYVASVESWNGCQDAPSPYLPIYYDNVHYYDQATHIELSELITIAQDINFTMLEGGQITGRVTDAGSGDPLANVEVKARPYDDGQWDARGQANSSGYYTITGLLNEDYRVAIDGQIPAGYAQQYYPDTFVHEFAERVTISGFGAAGGIDFHLVPGGVITGWVVDETTGQPIANMNVSAEPQNDRGGRGTCTDDQGYYELDGLIYADHIVHAPADTWNWCLNEPHEVYPRQYYDHAFSYNEATPVTIDGGSTLAPDINFSLVEGGFIEGVVDDTAAGRAPVGSLRMVAIIPGDCPWCHDWVADTDTAPDGSFSLGPLAPGQYALYACTGCSDILLVEQYYPAVYHIQDATLITATSGAVVTGLNMTLDPGIWLTGTVNVPNGYNPENIRLDAWQEEPFGFGTGRQTGPGGNYIIPVPPIYDSRWVIQVNPWESDLTFRRAAQFTLDQTHWDFELGHEAIISGWVTFNGGVPDYGWVNAESRWMDNGVEIDQNGYYEIHNLPPGDYRLRFDGWPDYMWTYYGGHDWSFANVILLDEGEVEKDFNFDVQLMGQLEGYVYDSDGTTPIEGAQIMAMDGEGMWYAWSQTDGYFSMDLPATDVKVLYNPADWPTHMFGFYNGVHTYADAEVVTVPPLAQGSANIDIIFQRRATIGGQVRDAGSGDPLGGIHVAALTVDTAADWENAAWSCTDENGDYYLEGVSPGDVEVMAVGTCGNTDYGIVTETLTALPGVHHALDLTVTRGTGLPDVFTIHHNEEPFGYTPIRGRQGMVLEMRDQILPALYAPLVDLNDQGQWYSELLTQVPTAANGLVTMVNDRLQVEYRLKSGLKWSDGASLTSADIRFTWEMLTQPHWFFDDYVAQVGTVWKVEEVLTPDPLTAVMIFERDAIPPAYLGAITYLLPQHLLNGRHPTDVQLLSHYAHNPVGNGPYRVVDWVPGSHMNLAANPNYHKAGAGYPRIREIRLLYNDDPFWSIVNGTADISLNNSQELPEEWQTYDVDLYTTLGQGFHSIVPNLTNPLFEDVAVRKALFTALNRQAHSDRYGLVNIVADGYLPPDYPLYDASHVTYTFNLANAAAALDAAGWTEDSDGDGVREKDGLEFEFNLYYNVESVSRQNLVTMFAADLATIGVDANVVSLPWEELIDNARRGELDAVVMGWIFDDRFDPLAYSLYHSSYQPTAYNRYEGSVHNTGWINPLNDSLLENAATELDFAALRTLYSDHLALYSDELPEWPVYYVAQYHLASPILVNFRPNGSMAATWNMETWELPANPYDLSVRQTLAANSQAPKPGNTITYQVEIRNVGYFPMNDAGFAETLPDDVVYLGATPAPDSVSGNTLQWSLGTVPGKSSLAPIFIRAQIPPSVSHGTSLTSFANVWPVLTDTHPSNNEYVYTIEVRDDVDLAVTKSGVGQPAVGEKFNYYIDYYNWGGAPAANVTITDTLPPEVSFLSADPAPTAMSGQVLTWTLPGLAGGQWGGQIEIMAEIVDAGTVTNTAEIGYDDAETTTDNNADDHVEQVDDILAPVILRPTQGSTDQTPTVSGLAPSGATVDIWDIRTRSFADLLGSTTAQPDGTFELELNLATGEYILAATAEKAGLTSGYSNAANIVVKDNLALDPDEVTIMAGDVNISAGSVEAERRLLPMRNLSVQAKLACGSRPTPTLKVTENALFVYYVPPVQLTDLGGGEWSIKFTFWMAEPHSSYEIFLEWDCGGEHHKVLLMYILIDPDGYVYDKSMVDAGSAIEDALLLDAEVTCYVKAGDNWVVWPADLYGQVNPQKTDSETDDGVLTAGYYSFLTPSGQYKVKATAEGYQPYESPVLTVITEAVHLDIGMQPVVSGVGQAKSPANLAASSKAVDRALAWLGDELTYDIWLTNNGDTDSGLLALNDPIPQRTAYVTGSLVVDGGSGSYSTLDNAIKWQGAVPAQDGIHIQYKVLVASTPGTPFDVINTAQVSGPPSNLVGLPALTARTTVQNQIALSLEADQSQAVEAGTTARYSHTLTNKGNFSDTFTFNAVSSQGWTAQKPADLTLGPGQSATVQVALLVPANVVSGTVDNLAFTAVSKTNNTFSATVTDKTTIYKTEFTVYLPIALKP